MEFKGLALVALGVSSEQGSSSEPGSQISVSVTFGFILKPL
jgi:hypothetical protein